MSKTPNQLITDNSGELTLSSVSELERLPEMHASSEYIRP